MNRSKRIFLLAALIFLALLIYASYDIASRTTFPGSKPQLKHRLEEKLQPKDSIRWDSAGNDQKKSKQELPVSK